MTMRNCMRFLWGRLQGRILVGGDDLWFDHYYKDLHTGLIFKVLRQETSRVWWREDKVFWVVQSANSGISLLNLDPRNLYELVDEQAYENAAIYWALTR